MPLYDYRCSECGQEVEVMHGIHDSGPQACQNCGGAMKKVLSPPAIHFKGSGWAKKDAAAATAKKAKPKASSGASTTTDDKGSADSPATKTETPAASGAATPSDTKAASGSTKAD